MIVAVLLSLVVVTAWEFLAARYAPPPPAPKALAAPTLPGANAVQGVLHPRAQVVASAPRVSLETPMLSGSINLKGARIDDLILTHYQATTERNSPDVELYSPEGSADAEYAGFGWAGPAGQVPDDNTVWQAQGNKLTPDTPVTLRWTNAQGWAFTIQFSIDKNYMITARQSVSAPGFTPFAYVSRTNSKLDY
ncbi:MAG: membrane protein insertase YidC, partial [Alphaproteobacteria bacterium]|nr:membrane protein insertase YidC [Alphaproteobacteria bacterium]